MIYGIPISVISIIFIFLFVILFIIWMKITGKISVNPKITKLDEFPFRLSNVVLEKKDEYEQYLRGNGFKLDSIYLVKLNDLTDKYMINYISNNLEVLAVITIVNSTIYISFESKFERGVSLVVSDFKDYCFQNNTIFLQRKFFISDLLKEQLLDSEFINLKRFKYQNIDRNLKESIKNEMIFVKENDLYFESGQYLHPKMSYILKRIIIFLGFKNISNNKELEQYINKYHELNKFDVNISNLLINLKGIITEVQQDIVNTDETDLDSLETINAPPELVETEIKPIIVKEGYGVKDNLGTLLGVLLLFFILYNVFTSFSFFEIFSTKNISTLFFIIPIVIFLVFSRFLLLVTWELIRFKTTIISHDILESLSVLHFLKREKKFKLGDFKLIEFSREKLREKFYHLKLVKEDYEISLISTKNKKEFLRYKEILEINYPDLYKSLKKENKKQKINIKSIILTTLISIVFLIVIFFFNVTTIGDTKYLRGKVVRISDGG